MKKMYNMLMMAMMGMMALSMTSCDEDESIAYTLEGTWKGNMYISSEWDGRYYDATYTEVTFSKDPYRYSSGTGYWVDYYNNAPWGSYVANHIDWKVDYGTIYIHFREEGTSLEIRDYHLNYDRFWGYIYDHGNNVDFELYSVYHPSSYYDDYRWGWDDWDYYWSRGGDGNKVEMPKRIVRNTK